MSSPYELLCKVGAEWPDNPLFLMPSWLVKQWERPAAAITYREVLDGVEQRRAAYAAAGYGAGHRVALLLENRPDHFLNWLALNALGVSVVPVNPDYKDDETAYLLEHSEAALIVVLPSRHAQVEAVAACVGVPLMLADGAVPAPRLPAPGGPCGLSAECALLYTSGTTGRPKGCMLSNEYFLGWGEWYVAQPGHISLRPGKERLLQPLPTFHTNGMGNSFMGMLMTGGAQVLLDRFHPRSWWSDAVETGATCFHYLGVMPAMLMNVPPGPHDAAHRMRYGLGGGVHPSHHAAFEKRFNTALLEGWAMTETGGAATMMEASEPRHVGQRCMGRADRPGPEMEVLIMGEDGQPAPDGVAGNFLVRAKGPNPRRRFFSGYLKDQAATDAAWAGGWLNTGDIVMRDAAGFCFFTDRKKNIVRRSGENIAAVEVEQVLAEHPAVGHVAIVAVSDEIREEEVFAAIAPRPGHAHDAALAETLFAWCLERLAYYKAPGYFAFMDRLPTTATQKIRKADLGDLAQNPAAHPNVFDLRARKQQSRPPKKS